MRMKNRIVLLLFALFSAGVTYCQSPKHKTVIASASAPRVFFFNLNNHSTNITRIKEILLADSLFFKNAAGKIISFDVYTSANRTAVTESTFGNRLSKKQKLLIGNLRPGQTVYLQKIMVKYPGKEKTMSSSKFIFKIKN
jgi:hypothetical protein